MWVGVGVDAGLAVAAGVCVFVGEGGRRVGERVCRGGERYIDAGLAVAVAVCVCVCVHVYGSGHVCVCGWVWVWV